ncbi:hypothetical protein Pint_12091 [Pistacia integerrima]|uniref:Uncharacterized protein n=1 Tax=Pistacia integerrima TaxID=434235 RepID=A0ACC0XJ72_9ROSI|nr:hypothetical protein Pint_12091 [Pistacia integerrima]
MNRIKGIRLMGWRLSATISSIHQQIFSSHSKDNCIKNNNNVWYHLIIKMLIMKLFQILESIIFLEDSAWMI